MIFIILIWILMVGLACLAVLEEEGGGGLRERKQDACANVQHNKHMLTWLIDRLRPPPARLRPNPRHHNPHHQLLGRPTTPVSQVFFPSFPHHGITLSLEEKSLLSRSQHSLIPPSQKKKIFFPRSKGPGRLTQRPLVPADAQYALAQIRPQEPRHRRAAVCRRLYAAA